MNRVPTRIGGRRVWLDERALAAARERTAQRLREQAEQKKAEEDKR